MIRGGTGENARLREKRQAEQRANDLESLDRINALLEREMDVGGAGVERIPSSPGAGASSAHDETDDVWTEKWEADFERSREEWERFA